MRRVSAETYQQFIDNLRATKSPLSLFEERYRAGRALIIETLAEDTTETQACVVRVRGAPGVYPKTRGFYVNATVAANLEAQGGAGGRRSAFLGEEVT